MCGIIGYIGDRQATNVIVDGLSKLEYRGYDSSGVAILSGGDLKIAKSVGKLKNLEEKLALSPILGNTGIGHTRWATHGRPSELNAHPHTDCKGNIAIVHNGIIENYMELRSQLIAQGHKFVSETDTEVIAHLIENFYSGDLEETFLKILPMLRGAYALTAVSKSEPERIVFARNESPLILGIGNGEHFAASDVPAFLSYAREIVLVENMELGYITKNSHKLRKYDGSSVNRKSSMVLWDAEMAEKSGFRHFMLKEIYEQPRSIASTLSGKVKNEKICLADANLPSDITEKIKRVSIVACGTAYHAGMLGKYFIEEIARIPVDIDVASEFRYRNPLISNDTLFIAISQSGETADTLAAIKEAANMGARTIAITNVVGSSITREVDGVIYTRAGLEMGVAATKTFTAQTLIMYILSLYLAQEKGVIDTKVLKEYTLELGTLAEAVETQLKFHHDIKVIARMFQNCRDFLFLGRNTNYPLALEGALKLKEISYIHAEGYAAGEMKHGPIALVDRDCPIVAVMTKNAVHEKIVSNIQEVSARDASIIAIASEGDMHADHIANYVIKVPLMTPYISTILSAIPLQMLSYYIADIKGCDVDKPRNLAKSVTVE